jgi:hypothetical protein
MKNALSILLVGAVLALGISEVPASQVAPNEYVFNAFTVDDFPDLASAEAPALSGRFTYVIQNSEAGCSAVEFDALRLVMPAPDIDSNDASSEKWTGYNLSYDEGDGGRPAGLDRFSLQSGFLSVLIWRGAPIGAHRPAA